MPWRATSLAIAASVWPSRWWQIAVVRSALARGYDESALLIGKYLRGELG